MTNRQISVNVEQELRVLIAQRFGPGAQLPPERELATMLDVSRPTLREVVSSMCRTGELERRWGVGTFVATTTRRFSLNLGGPPVPMRAMAREQGFDSRFIEFSTELIECPAESRPVLGLEPGELVWSVRRVLTLDGRPAVGLHDLVPARVASVSVDLSGLGKGDDVDLIPYLAAKTGLQLARLDLRLNVELATQPDARRFQLELASPLVVSRFVGRTADGTALSDGQVRYVPGRVEIAINGVEAGSVGSSPTPRPGVNSAAATSTTDVSDSASNNPTTP